MRKEKMRSLLIGALSMVVFGLCMGAEDVSAQAEEDVSAQNVRSRYGDSFPASIANEPSISVPGMTLLEQRDHGVDLFIGGVVTSALAPAVAGLGVATGAIVGSLSADTDTVDGLVIGAIVGGSVGGVLFITGTTIWIVGLLHWVTGNQALQGGLAISDNKEAMRLALAPTPSGVGLKISY